MLFIDPLISMLTQISMKLLNYIIITMLIEKRLICHLNEQAEKVRLAFRNECPITLEFAYEGLPPPYYTWHDGYDMMDVNHISYHEDKMRLN